VTLSPFGVLGHNSGSTMAFYLLLFLAGLPYCKGPLLPPTNAPRRSTKSWLQGYVQSRRDVDQTIFFDHHLQGSPIDGK
jgi:hypothetical protein